MHFQVKVTEMAGRDYMHCSCFVYSLLQKCKGGKKKKKKKKKNQQMYNITFLFIIPPTSIRYAFSPK